MVSRLALLLRLSSIRGFANGWGLRPEMHFLSERLQNLVNSIEDRRPEPNQDRLSRFNLNWHVAR